MRCSLTLSQTEIPQNFTSGAILTTLEMAKLQSDLENMVTPSWLMSVPANLGEPSHGKLKADQWHTLNTTYLSVSLVQLWNQLEDGVPSSARSCWK